MAKLVLDNFERKNVDEGKEHGSVSAKYFVFKIGNDVIFQIDTYGTKERKNAGKISQSIQFDKKVAQKLVEIFKQNKMID